MKHLIAELTEPTPGKEAEFNDYYENLHLDEVLATSGWRSAQRFVLTDEAGQKCPHKYLALYQVEADDARDIIETLNATRPQRQQSDALNRANAALWERNGPGARPLRQRVPALPGNGRLAQYPTIESVQG